MKNLYKYSPVFLQDIAITLINNYKYYQKYGAIPFVKPLKKVIEQLDTDINDQGTLLRVNHLIKEAIKHVPYYRENREHYQPISSLSEINRLPILRKSILKDHNEKFISEKCTPRNSYNFKTSGSTGTPLKGAISLEELNLRFQVFFASLKREGINYSLPVARFLGANITGGSSKVYRKDFINNHYLFSIYDLSVDNTMLYYNALAKNKIKIIEGYPSTIYSLVKLLRIRKLQLPEVQHVLTTAEKLLDYQKEEIEDFFQLKIFDYYGSSEGSAYMFLTQEGYYLNSNKIAYFETVDECDKVLQDEPGRMLITSFTSSFTPLIRYDIGDICEIIENKNQTIKVKEIIGRQDDVFVSPDGIEFSRFSLVLKYLPKNVQESQLLLWQETNKAEVHYIALEAIPLKEFHEFQTKLNSILKVKFNIKYIHILTFGKHNRGKLSAVKIIKNEN